MATVTKTASSWEIPSNSSYANHKWKASIEVVTSITATQTTITVKLYFYGGYTGDWGQVGKYVSGSIKIGTHTKSFSDGSQSWSFTNLSKKLVLTYSYTYDRKTSSQSIAITGTVKVNSPSAYRNGTSSTVSYTTTVPILQSFNINFYDNLTSNGGSKLETRTYYYNQSTFATYGLPDYTGGTWDLTRTGYNATSNWQTTTSGGTLIPQNKTYATTQALYKAIKGSDWSSPKDTNGSAITLYAGWEVATIAPTVTATTYRVSNSSDNSPNPSGTYVYICLTNYTHGMVQGVAQQSSTVLVQAKEEGSSTWKASTTWNITNNQAASDFNTTWSTFEITKNYIIKLTISNDAGSNSVEIKIPAVKFPIDLQVNGNDVYMGLMHEADSSKQLITTSSLYVDGVLDGNLETPTISISNTTGTATVTAIKKWGKVVQLYLSFKNSSAVTAGDNLYAGTLNTTSLIPAGRAEGTGYYGGSAIIAVIGSTGSIVARVTAANLAANKDVHVSFTYLVN